MRRVLSLCLPDWATDRLRRSGVSPDLPLVAVQRAGARRVVMAACPRARALGLRAGMAVAHAQAIAPGIHVAEADEAGDRAALGRLAAWCLRFSPLASPDPGGDGVWIETGGCTHLFGGEAALLEDIASRVEAAGFACRAAIAGTPGTAHAVARFGGQRLAVVAQEGNAAVLEPLPVSALRLAEESVDALRLLGFDRIGQLMRTPRAPLARRFGTTVFARLDQALGRAAEPIAPVLPPELPRARLGFPEPIASAEDFHRAILLLAEALCVKLERLGLGACRADLLCQRIDGTTQALRVGTAAPTRDAAHLARLLAPLVETIDPGFGVERMMLAASMTERLGARQMGSGLAGLADGPDLSGLVDTLLNRLGEDHVFRAQPVQSDVPERSHRRVAPLSRATGAGWPAHLPRPARLFDPPRAVQAMALLPDHAPARFTWRGRPHSIRRADGPERVYGEWWKDAGETWSVRDYFQVEDEHGQRFWLFRSGDGVDGATGGMQWFLHGVFG